MARSLTASATTEKNKTAGAFPRRVLEIQYSGGTQYYASDAFDPGSGGDTLGTTTSARVITWGEITMEAAAGTVGGHGQVSILLRDEDLALKTIFDTKPGVQNVHAFIHLWFDGTGWSDRVTIFGGVLTTPLAWDSKTGVWTVTAKGFELFYDRDLGRKLDRENFPEVMCEGSCEGALIPIAYGNPVTRVPACVIDRPGSDVLGSYLPIHEATLEINRDASVAGFTVGSPITLAVGWPQNIELIQGEFSSDGTTFTISDRGAIQASGFSPGVFASGGERFLLLDRADLTNPDQSRVGWVLYYDANNDGNWVTLMVDEWFKRGSSQGVMREPREATFKTGAAWKLSRWPSDVYWQTGTPVHELGPWTYVANMLPSTSVERVEARGEVEAHDPRGTKVMAYFTYDPSRYTVNLSNTSYNAALGLSGGLTTITLDAPPARYGLTDDRIYVTLINKNNAGEIIQDLMTNADLGAVPSALVDTPLSNATPFAFAITSEKKMADCVADLAQQANALLFWDGGKAYLKTLSNTLSGSVLTATFANSDAEQGLAIEASPVADVPTEISGKMKTSLSGEEIELVRVSTAAAAEYGKRRRVLDLWAHQSTGDAAGVLEFWLTYYLNRNRIVALRTYLNGIQLQPGDVVTLNFASGDGTTIFSNKLARVLSLTHTAGDVENGTMESILVTVEVNLWSWAIVSVATPQDEDCEDPIAEPDYYDPEEPSSKQTSPNRPGRPFTPNTPRRTFPYSSSSSGDFSSSTPPSSDLGSSPSPTSTGATSSGTSSAGPPSSSAGPPSSSAGPPSSSGVGTSGAGTSGTSGTSGSSASIDCINILAGVELELLDQSLVPEYVLSLSGGCLTLTPTTICQGESSGGP